MNTYVKVTAGSDALAFNAVDRLIKVHQASLQRAEHLREANPPRSTAEPTDCPACRAHINALEREISRLRRGLERPEPIEHTQPDEPLRPHRPDDFDRPLDPSVQERRPYAVDPLNLDALRGDAPPPADPALVNRIENYYHITNLGTLLDVLA